MIFGDVPDEVKQAMEAQMERAEMAGTAFRHDINRLIRNLPQDDLLTFKNLMRHMQESLSTAFYLEGVAATTLELRYDLCGGCGKNHEQDLLGAPREDPTEGTEQLELEFDGLTTDEAVDRVALMDEYNLYEGADKDGKPTGEIFCRGCDTQVASLEDRMLRPSGVRGCPGCQHKAKFG
jgi:hypothetical protein